MVFVRRAAEPVLNDDHAKATIDRAEHGRENTDIGFCATDQQRINLPFDQMCCERREGKS